MHQQVSGEPVQELTKNNELPTIEEEEYTQHLTNVERDMDVVRATLERIDAALVHIAQGINAQVCNNWRPDLGHQLDGRPKSLCTPGGKLVGDPSVPHKDRLWQVREEIR